jgi:hypothetical protein
MKRPLLTLLAVGAALSCSTQQARNQLGRVNGSAAAPVASLGPVAAIADAPRGRYVPPSAALSFEDLRAQMPGAQRITDQQLAARHPLTFASAAAFDVDRVEGMTTVQSGPFALNERERALLARNGFALAPRLARPNFLTGYVSLYLRDQPVYVSADAITNALHESFDTLISNAESDALLPALTAGLAQLRTRLATATDLSPATRGDVDSYVAITLSALRGAIEHPVANGDDALVTAVFGKLSAGAGAHRVALFGDARDVDFSQMRPRGHYAGNAALERYFRAVMWLGREGFRLIDTRGTDRVVSRRQLEGALAIHALSDERTRAAFELIESTITQFAGEPEALGFRDMDTLARRLSDAGGLGALSDARLLSIIDEVRGVRPRIATSMLVHPEGWTGTVPQPVAFSLAAQRYTPDSRVLTHVSYDRIDQGRAVRMLPSPLDAAFGALGNDQSLAFLTGDLQRFGYATELDTTRVLVDAHERGYWQGSLYASWLAALRTLSPRETLANASTLPATMTTEAWGRRLLNTQLAAWAEVRHDTILYTAQSYSVSLGCSYPHAYVDPYPELWSGLSLWVERARTLIGRTPWQTQATRDRWTQWASRASAVVSRLRTIAERERAGEEMTRDDLAWMNQALNAREVSVVCATEVRVDGGWYYDLFEPRRQLGEDRAIVADVHTAPEDEHGNPVGVVLHIGTSAPQPMVVIAGPRGRERAYVGFAYSYRERVTHGFDRLTDERWRREASQASAPSWLREISGAPR